MARARKSIKPHLEKYNSFVENVQAREFTRRNIDVIETITKILKQAAKESYNKKLKIVFDNTLVRINDYYLKDKIALSHNTSFYSGEGKSITFSWMTKPDDLTGYYNWNEYFKKEFRFVMDFEKADEYAKEIFGKEFTATAGKGNFSIYPHPCSKNVKTQNEALLNEIVKFLNNEKIEFEIEKDFRENPTISIDFKQFFDFEEIEKEQQEIFEKEELEKELQILKEIEEKKKELEKLMAKILKK